MDKLFAWSIIAILGIGGYGAFFWWLPIFCELGRGFDDKYTKWGWVKSVAIMHGVILGVGFIILALGWALSTLSVIKG